MTDKQIIIDGIDVNGCECLIEKMDVPNNLEGGYYNQNNPCECGVQGVESYSFFCKNNPNCYYKQLKRKEQALDEIEKYLDAQQKYFDGEDYHNLLGIINKTKGKTNAY